MTRLTDAEFTLARSNSAKGNPRASMSLAEHSLACGQREQAKNYYILAATQGSSAAANAAAVLFAEDGANDDAVKWLRIACRAGNSLACIHLSLAYMGGGLGLTPDKKKAAEYGRLGDATNAGYDGKIE